MAFWSSRKSPVERAVADVEERIVALQRQMRELEASTSNSLDPARAQSSTVKLTEAVKEILTPPTKKPVKPSDRRRRDLFDVPTEPLKELEAEPIAFAQKPELDLFTPVRPQIDCSTKPQDKLAHYLSAGSIKSYKPLKHVQRQTRNRFFMWVGLSLIALWFIYAVVR